VGRPFFHVTKCADEVGGGFSTDYGVSTYVRQVWHSAETGGVLQCYITAAAGRVCLSRAVLGMQLRAKRFCERKATLAAAAAATVAAAAWRPQTAVHQQAS